MSQTAGTQSVGSRVLTVPNVISAARLVAVPVFGWLLLQGSDLAAFVLLLVASASDFVDGWLARALGQVSRLGILLDPVADRLYVIVAVLALAWRETVPWWVVVALLGRDAVLAVNLLVLRRRGIGPLPVHVIGKAATFALFWGFPLLILDEATSGAWTRAIGWALLLWGLYLYWWAGAGYLVHARRLLRAGVAA
ncbi:MAG: CDP-alcohol phosphatidyltransferase family protein [Kineosporiaceae bacterium]